MHDEHVTLTREALYEKVWKTPMSRLAAEFGISDVALAKICKKLDVPIPSRGYWARVTNGQKVKQPKLPRLREHTRTEFTIAKREPCDPYAPKEQPDVPDVVVADSLAGAHPAVRKLSSLLDGREPGRAKTLYLRGDSEATVRLGERTRRRALLILDALLRALEARGHAATFKIPKDAWTPHDLEVKVGPETVKLFIAEPLTRTEHKLTPKEEAERIRYGSSLFAPRHDFDPFGQAQPASPWLLREEPEVVRRYAAAPRRSARHGRTRHRGRRSSHGRTTRGDRREPSPLRGRGATTTDEAGPPQL